MFPKKLPKPSWGKLTWMQQGLKLLKHLQKNWGSTQQSRLLASYRSQVSNRCQNSFQHSSVSLQRSTLGWSPGWSLIVFNVLFLTRLKSNELTLSKPSAPQGTLTLEKQPPVSLRRFDFWKSTLVLLLWAIMLSKNNRFVSPSDCGWLCQVETRCLTSIPKTVSLVSTKPHKK